MFLVMIKPGGESFLILMQVSYLPIQPKEGFQSEIVFVCKKLIVYMILGKWLMLSTFSQEIDSVMETHHNFVAFT